MITIILIIIIIMHCHIKKR